MRREPIITDPRHGRSLPSGRSLARVARQILNVQRAAFLRNPRGFRPEPLPYFDLLLPVFERYALEGARAAGWQVNTPVHLNRKISQGFYLPAIGFSAKSFRQTISATRFSTDRKGVKDVLFGAFDVIAPQILAVARRMTFAFLEAFGLATSKMLREALGESAEQGETGVDLQRRLVPIFGSERAAVIGQTEASRVTHEGQRIADKEGGLERREWLCSADACDLCLALDGKIVGIDEPFLVDPKRGAYAVVMGPGLHPRCQCTVVGVF